MLTLDTIIASGIVLAAAIYLYWTFSAKKKDKGCHCASGGNCCKTRGEALHHHCAATKD